MVLVAVDVPNTVQLGQPKIDTLPAGWDALPASNSAQRFGAAWLARRAELGMVLPSVVIPEEANILINPNHPAYSAVTLTATREFSFDRRMFGP
jgi:RES domain-containing protein